MFQFYNVQISECLFVRKKSNRTYKWLILSKREYYMLGNINDSVINIHITEIKHWILFQIKLLVWGYWKDRKKQYMWWKVILYDTKFSSSIRFRHSYH